MNRSMAKAFGIETDEVETSKKSLVSIENEMVSIHERVKENAGKDYDFVHGNLKTMIDSTMSMIPDLVELCQQAQTPRMYESASIFIKMVADLNKDLISTTKEFEESKNDKKPSTKTDETKNETTNVYIGTGSDIFERLSKPKVETSTVAVVKSSS